MGNDETNKADQSAPERTVAKLTGHHRGSRHDRFFNNDDVSVAKFRPQQKTLEVSCCPCFGISLQLEKEKANLKC